ncbi:hypothetical protein C5167_012045 [Papaver somniferum]|uniref:Suppressor of forked domain-containing protein n=1 Tax=Papaver somniferum TaxID=3469 RepID=A0A4Y7J0A7_PAPSO|nr:hypothetical protein C5167_012045 [Papaver somniferum]
MEIYERAIANVPPGSGIYTCGSIMLCTKSLMPKTWINERSLQKNLRQCNWSVAAGAKDKIKFAELEISLGETERTRAIFELATEQHHLDMPELYERYVLFLAVLDSKFRIIVSKDTKNGLAGPATCNREPSKREQSEPEIFERALKHYRENAPELKERAMLLEEWLKVGQQFGSVGDTNIVEKRMLKSLKKRKEISSDDGPTAYEEYHDYIFPEETSWKLLISGKSRGWLIMKIDST